MVQPQLKRGRSPSPESQSGIVDPDTIHQNKAKVVAEFTKNAYVNTSKFSIPELRKFCEDQQRNNRVIRRLFFAGTTGWKKLQTVWDFQPPEMDGWKQNTDYGNTAIDLMKLKEWEDFPTYADILAFSKSSPLLEYNFHKAQLTISNLSWQDGIFKDKTGPPPKSENNLVAELGQFFAELNGLIRLASHSDDEHSRYVTIAGGRTAMKRRINDDENDKASNKDPDRASFWWDGKFKIPRSNGFPSVPQSGTTFPSTQVEESPQPAENIPCLIVGDLKLHRKFNRQMLAGVLRNRRQGDRAEVQRVMNQIHDYMDMSGGFLVLLSS